MIHVADAANLESGQAAGVPYLPLIKSQHRTRVQMTAANRANQTEIFVARERESSLRQCGRVEGGEGLGRQERK